eukprot:7884069-Alexandrium_andersonii.AAC.1
MGLLEGGLVCRSVAVLHQGMWRWALGGERGPATERTARLWLTAAETRLLPTCRLQSRLGRLP